MCVFIYIYIYTYEEYFAICYFEAVARRDIFSPTSVTKEIKEHFQIHYNKFVPITDRRYVFSDLEGGFLNIK